MSTITLDPPAAVPEVTEPPVRERRKPGRKTNAEREQRALEHQRALRAREQESKRAKRIQPDTRTSLIVALSIAGVALVTSFTISYANIAGTAEWMKLSWHPLVYIVPGFIELLMVFSTLDYIISRSRGDSGRTALGAMVVLSAIAVLGGAAHTIAGWGSAFSVSNWEAMVGTILSAAAPLVVVFVSKRLSALVFEVAE